MSLPPGSKLGPYEIVAPLGAGGMGEVYRARDTKLDREVAIKVLPEAVAQNPERLARFEREAKVLASLNHPNIAQIYGVEDRAIVMELVEGEEIKGPLPLDTVLDYARQIADALEAAHEKNIVHRDLKPANIKVTQQGMVKVLDFGLAAVMQDSTPAGADPANSPTLTMRQTQMGMLLGTAGYMSPEQARGGSVDKRADIWAFGVVLYEMLTGKRLFEGKTVSDTLAAVLMKEPDWRQLPERTPSAIRRLLRRCLERDLKRRMPDIGSARLEIDEADAAGPEAAEAQTDLPHRKLPWAVAAVLGLGLITVGTLYWRAARPAERPMWRLSVDLGPEAVAGAHITAVLSPDGTRLAFPARGPDGKQQLATRLLDQAQTTVLSGTGNAADPFFSPDGQWIGFFADDRMKKVSVHGGAVVTLCDAPNPRGVQNGQRDLGPAAFWTIRNHFRSYRVPSMKLTANSRPMVNGWPTLPTKPSARRFMCKRSPARKTELPPEWATIAGLNEWRYSPRMEPRRT